MARRWSLTTRRRCHPRDCKAPRTRESEKKLDVRGERELHLRPPGWNRIKALATVASLQSRLDATPRDTWCPRLFFIIRILIQGQTPRGTGMIFPGVGRVTHRETPYHFILSARLFLPDLRVILVSFKNSSHIALIDFRFTVVAKWKLRSTRPTSRTPDPYNGIATRRTDGRERKLSRAERVKATRRIN